MGFKTLSAAGKLNKNTCLELTVTVRESSQTTLSIKTGGFPGGSVKDPPAMRQTPALEESPGGGHGNPLQYYCLENPHGQRSLAGYHPQGCEESDMIEQLSTPIMKPEAQSQYC